MMCVAVAVAVVVCLFRSKPWQATLVCIIPASGRSGSEEPCQPLLSRSTEEVLEFAALFLACT